MVEPGTADSQELLRQQERPREVIEQARRRIERLPITAGIMGAAARERRVQLVAAALPRRREA
jgi:hypothetical protein